MRYGIHENNVSEANHRFNFLVIFKSFTKQNNKKKKKIPLVLTYRNMLKDNFGHIENYEKNLAKEYNSGIISILPMVIWTSVVTQWFAIFFRRSCQENWGLEYADCIPGRMV